VLKSAEEYMTWRAISARPYAGALEMFAENKFKVELISNLPLEAVISCYRCGPMVDLCRG